MSKKYTNWLFDRVTIKLRVKLNAILSLVVARRIASAVLWSFLSEVVSKGLMFLSWIIVARILGKEGYGEFGIIRTTITMFAIFGGMGLGLTANKFLAENRIKNKAYGEKIIGLTYILTISLGLVIGIIAFLASNYLCVTLLKAPKLVIEVKIAALMLFFSAINGGQIGILQGLEAYRKLAFVSFCQGLSAIPFFLVGTYYWGLTGAIVAFALNIIVCTVVLQFVIQKELAKQDISISYKGLSKILPVLWKFSLPAALAGIAISPVKWYSEALLSRNGGFGALGIFHAAFIITNLLITVTSTLHAPLVSISANTEGFSNHKKLHYLTVYGSWFLFLILATPFLFFPRLLVFFFGESFNNPDLYRTSLLLICYSGLLMYYQGLSRIILLHNSLWFMFATNIVEGLSLILAFYFLGNYSSIGLGYAYIFSYLVRILISFPVLLNRKMISSKILFDKYFFASLIAFFIIIILLLKTGGL